MTAEMRRKLNSRKDFASAFNHALFQGLVRAEELEMPGFDYSSVKDRPELEKARHLFENVVCHTFRGCDLIMVGLDRKEDLMLFELCIKGLYSTLCYMEQIRKFDDPSRMRPVVLLTAYFGENPFED